MVAFLPRTYAHIRRAVLAANYRSIQRAVGPAVETVAVVKADAYGHGAAEIAPSLLSAGARWFAVASVEEGLALRHAGVEAGILLLAGIESGGESEAREHRLTPLITSRSQLRAWNQEAKRAGVELPFHLTINTGMNRLGLDAQSADEVVSLIGLAGNLRFEGLATHLASAEDFSNSHATEQHHCFTALAAMLAEKGIRPRYLHVSNSAAIAYRPEMDSNMIRAGLALYGYVNPPKGEAVTSRLNPWPVLEWKSRLVAIHEVDTGALVGYNGSYRAEKPMRIGVISAGYGDGVNRGLSNRGHVLVGGVRCPIVGLISMDLTTVDLSPAPQAVEGDEVMLLGEGLNADEIAAHCQTISYDVLSSISRRVARVYSDE